MPHQPYRFCCPCIPSVQFREENFQLRDKDLHEKQCQYVERPGISSSEKEHFSKVYGINRKSLLARLTHFDVTKQLPQDLMHVLFEGIFPFHVHLLLDYLSLSVSEINSRLVSYPYAYFEVKPAKLSSTKLAQTGIY